MVTLNNDGFLQENAVHLKATKAKGLEGGGECYLVQKQHLLKKLSSKTEPLQERPPTIL